MNHPMRVTHLIASVSLLMFVMLFLPGFVYAQASGSIEGVVVDANNAVMPNATVTVHCNCSDCPDVPCGECCPQSFSRTVSADGEGKFRVPDVPSGVYSISAEASGFAKATVKGVRVQPSASQTVRITIGAVGDTSSQVTVTQANSPQVKVKVVDEISNKPVANATVTLRRRSCDCKSECPGKPCDDCCPFVETASTQTDIKGTFTTSIEPGEYMFRVETGAYTKDEQFKVTDSKNQKIEIEVALDQARTLSQP